MARLWIKDLQMGQAGIVEIDVHILRGDVLKTRKGEDYLSLTLEDRTGRVAAKRWKASRAECEALANVSYAHVSARVGEYEEKLQLVLEKPLEDLGTPDDLTEFEHCSPIPLVELQARLHAHISSVRDPRLQALLKAVFVEDKTFSSAFLEYPAAMGMHHAFRHGLLQHTLEVTDIVAAATERQHQWGGTPIHRDLAITGALLHDIGKIKELHRDADTYEFSDAGSLLGHIMLGFVFLVRKIVKLRTEKGIEFPALLENMLLHLVCSHHGKGEWGSPKAPMTPEAIVLHMADKMSADLYYLQEARAEASGQKQFVRQSKLESGFGGNGRRVFVGNMEALLASDIEEAPTAEPVGYPIPPSLRLPVLRLVEASDSPSDALVRSLPVYGKIAAGQPLLHSDNQEGEFHVDFTALGRNRGEFYLLRVQGDSMTGDGIEDGDLVVVRPQQDADHGDLVVALLDGEGATVKRLVRNNGEIVLMPSNHAHSPIAVLPSTQLDIQGRVVGIARRL